MPTSYDANSPSSSPKNPEAPEITPAVPEKRDPRFRQTTFRQIPKAGPGRGKKTVGNTKRLSLDRLKRPLAVAGNL
jgi:hypothetical protein